MMRQHFSTFIQIRLGLYNAIQCFDISHGNSVIYYLQHDRKSELCKFHKCLRLKWGEERGDKLAEVVAISEDFTGSEFCVNE